MVDEKGEKSYCLHPWAGPLGGQESSGFTQSAWKLGKKMQMNLFTKQKQTHRFREEIYREGKGGGVWDWDMHNTVYKTDNQQGPTV